MKKGKDLRIIFIVFLTFILYSCGVDKTRKDDISRKDINDYPFLFDISNSRSLDKEIPSYGISDIRVIDSLLIVSVENNRNFWNIYHIPEMNLVDTLFNVGDGPGEFYFPVPVSFSSILIDENQNKKLAIPTISDSKMVILKQDSVINNFKFRTDTIIDVPFPNNSLITYVLNNNKALNFIVDPEKNNVKRELVALDSKRKYENIPLIEKLNEKQVEDMSQISYLITQHSIKPDGSTIAEITNYDNKVYIYDTEGEKNIEITFPFLKKEASKGLKLLNGEYGILGGGYGYKDFFTISRYNNLSNGKYEKYLDFINWDGEPLGSIKLKNAGIGRSDLSLNEGLLFCVDSDNDKIDIYDISDFLKKIESLVSK